MEAKNAESVAREAGAAVNQLLGEDRSYLLLFSGGSSLSLVDYISPQVMREGITIGVLDERYDQNPSRRNFERLAHTSFYEEAKRRGALSLPIYTPEVNLENTGKKFDLALKVWRQKNPGGTIIATMGIGNDGHTAGIMPYPNDPQTFRNLFQNPDVWAVGYDSGPRNPHPERVTATLSFLQLVDHAVLFFLVAGKEAALQRTFSKSGSLHETPGRIVLQMKNVAVATDVKEFQL